MVIIIITYRAEKKTKNLEICLEHQLAVTSIPS
jgi:hypothetical protein